MKLCIFGAGAIGGYIGAKLSLAGADVTLIARGPHLAAMQKNGLTLIEGGETIVTYPRCVETASEAGVQDYVVMTLKAHSVPGVVDVMAPLFGPDTALVWGVNGVPWWYFHALPGAHENNRLTSVDPGNVQWDGFGPERAIGCVVYPACEVVEPGVVEHISGNRFTLGEPNGGKTDRIQALSEIMITAGLKAPIRPRIRDEIWVKLWGNLCFNPISALTGATLDVIATEAGTRSLARAMMGEARIIGESLGVKFPIDVDKRIDGAAAVGAHKTSMLQDLERGRPMEIDALVTAVQEMGRLTDTPTPNIDGVLALIQQRASQAGLYALPDGIPEPN
ncbi:MAG: 2-dehydropantoate 2-reductase [Alphaproteobacteria bacterium]|jgi:2-dehydropantoate 2-reductase